MSKPNFFVDIDALQCLLNMDLATFDPDNYDNDIDLTFDLIDIPVWFSFSSDKETQTLKAFTQMDLYSKDEAMTHDKGSLTLEKATGQIKVKATEDIADNMGVFFIACRKLSCLIHENKIDALYTGIDPEQGGIYLTEKNGKLDWKAVTGKERPELTVQTLFGGTTVGRPYMDDFMERSMREMMPLDQKIKAAEDGDVACMEELASLYLNGDDDTKADPKKAVYWMQKMADAGNSVGMFNLGLHYAKGHGVARDFKKAAEWMDKAAAAGDEDAPQAAARYRKIADSIEKAESGDAQAMADYAGGLMEMGSSLDQAGPGEDYKEAFKWAKKAADLDNGDGIWTLALAYEHGRGVEQDVDKAVELYKRGAELGNARCQCSYGAYLGRGDHVSKNPKEGFRLMLAAAEQKYPLAMKNVGLCYQFANGVTGNMKTAIEWFEKYLQYEDDPEIEQKVSIFKSISTSDPSFGEDYGDPGYDDDEPMPDQEFSLSFTKKGDRKERSNRLKAGDKVTLKYENGLDKVVAYTSLGDVGELSSYTWVKTMLDKNVPYQAELSEVISYDRLTNKRQNPTVKVRLHFDKTCGEMRSKMGWDHIPDSVFDTGTSGYLGSANDVIRENLEAAGKPADEESIANLSYEEALDAYLGVTEDEEKPKAQADEKKEPKEEKTAAKKPAAKSDMTYKFDEHLSFDLPSDYEIATGKDDDGKTTHSILCGVKKNEDGEKTQDVTIKLQKVDGSVEPERVNLKGDFPALVSGRISEMGFGLQMRTSTGTTKASHTLTMQLLFLMVGFSCGEDVYAIVAIKTGLENAFSENAELIAKHVNRVLEGLTLDGKPGNFERLTGKEVERILKEGTEEEDDSGKKSAEKPKVSSDKPKTEKTEAEKEAAKKKAAEEKARKEREAAEKKAEEERLNGLKREYKEAVDAWEKECDSVRQKIKQEKAKRIKAEEDKYKQTAQDAYTAAVDAANAAIIRQEEIRKTAQAKLATLGFFKFTEKSEQNAIIATAKQAIQKAENDRGNALAAYNTKLANMGENLKAIVKDIKDAVEDEYPLPKKPEKPAELAKKEKEEKKKQEAERKKREAEREERRRKIEETRNRRNSSRSSYEDENTRLINKVAYYLAKSPNDNIGRAEFRRACIACDVDPDSFTSSDFDQLQKKLNEIT